MHQLHEEVDALVETKRAPAKANKLAKKAVEQARFLLGTGSLVMRPRDEERIRARIDGLIKKIVATAGVEMDYNWIHDQIFAQAKSLGARTPMPGKDI